MDANSGVFTTPREALTFALNFSGQQYPLSMMSKLMQDGPMGSGRGLVGVDGAAQAGMVIRELLALDSHSHYGACALVARCVTPHRECGCRSPCCVGTRPNEMWAEAVAELTDYAIQHLGTGLSNRAFRRAVVEKCFGKKVSVEQIAEDCGIHRNTASKHNGAIRKGLRELEARAWENWDIRIAESGMLDLQAA